jgi:hypothetical protein
MILYTQILPVTVSTSRDIRYAQTNKFSSRQERHVDILAISGGVYNVGLGGAGECDLQESRNELSRAKLQR